MGLPAPILRSNSRVLPRECPDRLSRAAPPAMLLGFNPDVACHHGPILDIHTGVYDPTCDPTVARTPFARERLRRRGLVGWSFTRL